MKSLLELIKLPYRTIDLIIAVFSILSLVLGIAPEEVFPKVVKGNFLYQTAYQNGEIFRFILQAIGIVLLFFLIFYLTRQKSTRKPKKSCVFDYELKCVRKLFNFLEDYPYNNPSAKESYLKSPFVLGYNYREAHKIYARVEVLKDIKTSIVKNEKLKINLNDFLKLFKWEHVDLRYGNMDAVIAPVFKNEGEYNRERAKIKKMVKLIIRALEKNRVL